MISFVPSTTGNNGTGTAGTFELGGGTDEVVGSVVFQITGASSLSGIVKAGIAGSSQTRPNIQYVNLATGAVSAAGTAITADGLYAVFAPGCRVDFVVSAGTATAVECVNVLGRVF